jgi:hypothetical protein
MSKNEKQMLLLDSHIDDTMKSKEYNMFSSLGFIYNDLLQSLGILL